MTVFAELSPPYSTIVADPPWHYDAANPPNPGRSLGTETRGQTLARPLPYASMSLRDILQVPVGDLTTDGRCFLWVTNRHLFDAPDVLRAWGFVPHKRVLVWCKPPMGTLNVTTEFVLMGRKGNPPRLPWHGTTWFAWPRPFAHRDGLHTGHSRKPDAFGDLVESWCPGPYVELFARAPRLGWDSWGKGYEIGAAS